MLHRGGLRALLAIAFGLGAQAINAEATAVSGAAIKAHTAFLSDDLLDGREAGTRGYDIAAAYVATQFALHGLKPAGTNSDFYQNVPLRRRSLQPDGVRFEIRTKSGAQLYQNGKEIAVDASANTLAEVIEADVVFAGWGIRAPGLQHDDYAGLNVKGKAVVILEGAPASFPGALRAHYSWIQQKERMAAEAGAVALLTLKSPEREQFSPWERTRQVRPMPALGWLDPEQREHAPTIQATITLGPKVARSLFAQGGRNVDEIYRQSISSAPRGFDLPASIRLARKSVHEDSSTSNVIGVLPGMDARLKEEYIAVVSHLDAWVGPKTGPDTIYNGAVDNAGGIAAMLEVARVLAARGGAKRSVLFFATAAEEKGLLGSDYFVAHPLVPLNKIVGVVSVDGLMAFHDFAGIVALGAEHSTLGEISLAAARSIGAVHEPDPIPARGNLALSDQYPFLRVGIPVLFPNPARGSSRGGGEDVAAWDEYESRHYHQPSDDMTLPLRWDVAERWGQYMYEVVAGAANAWRRPLWYQGDELAAVFAPAAERAKRPHTSSPSNAAGSSDCSADERAAYICNVRNAEDLLAIRDTAWVIAGRLTDPPAEGGFYLIDSGRGTASPLVPDFSRPKSRTYSECPGAPGKDEFAAHGIAIRYRKGSKHELYAVNHNGRQSIEIFDLDVSARRPALTWKGCVVVPHAVMPNSVAPVPSGGFVVTSFGIRTDAQTLQKAMRGGVSGFVAKWTPGAGWSEVPGTQFSANNGVAISDDGKRMFVTSWGDSKLHVISLEEIPYGYQSLELGGFHPDNIRATADGRLLIAGQAATPVEVFACTTLPTCELGFKVIAVDPRSLSIEPLLDEPGSRSFGGASAAILVGDEIWVGTFKGSRIARYRLGG